MGNDCRPKYKGSRYAHHTDAFLHLLPPTAPVQVKFVEQHAEVSDATAAFVRFSLAAGVSLPFADLREKEVLFAGEENRSLRCSRTSSGECLVEKHCFRLGEGPLARTYRYNLKRESRVVVRRQARL